jgi:hypothetical protein
MLSLFNSGESTKGVSLQYLPLHGIFSQSQQRVLVWSGYSILLGISAIIAVAA